VIPSSKRGIAIWPPEVELWLALAKRGGPNASYQRRLSFSNFIPLAGEAPRELLRGLLSDEGIDQLLRSGGTVSPSAWAEIVRQIRIRHPQQANRIDRLIARE